jgi:hypothetical protein
MYGAVGAPSSTSAADSTNLPLLQGKAGEGLVAELHGKWYTAAYRNRVFFSSTLAAGTTIPISSTTAPTFTIYNPLGSGVNVEMISIDVAITNATTVVSPISVTYTTGLIVAPTSVTALTVTSGIVGGSGVAQAKVYSAATLAAALTTSFPIFSISATSGSFPLLHYDFDGKFILPPGSLACLTGTAAQTSATMNSAFWAEWPI